MNTDLSDLNVSSSDNYRYKRSQLYLGIATLLESAMPLTKEHVWNTLSACYNGIWFSLENTLARDSIPDDPGKIRDFLREKRDILEANWAERIDVKLVTEGLQILGNTSVTSVLSGQKGNDVLPFGCTVDDLRGRVQDSYNERKSLDPNHQKNVCYRLLDDKWHICVRWTQATYFIPMEESSIDSPDVDGEVITKSSQTMNNAWWSWNKSFFTQTGAIKYAERAGKCVLTLEDWTDVIDAIWGRSSLRRSLFNMFTHGYLTTDWGYNREYPHDRAFFNWTSTKGHRVYAESAQDGWVVKGRNINEYFPSRFCLKIDNPS